MSVVPRLAVLAALPILWGGPALANNVLTQTATTVFSRCDGFGMPSSGGDGMTGYAMIWGVFNPPGYGTTDKTTAAKGAEGVAACEAALADAEHLKAQYWMRRVNLLKALALHELERDDSKAALAALDRASAAVVAPDDPFYARSLGLGLDAVRAYALRKDGQTEKGAALARQVAERRPFSKLAALSGLTALGADASGPTGRELAIAVGRLHPQFIQVLFASAFYEGRWGDAVSLYDQQATPLKRYFDRRLGRDVDTVDRVAAETFWINCSAALAYAYAALGREAESRAALQKARDRLAAATADAPDKAAAVAPPPAAGETSNASRAAKEAEKQAAARLAQNAQIKATGEKSIQYWSRAVERRASLAKADAASILPLLAIEPLPRGSVGLDMLGLLESKVTGATAEAQATRAALAEIRKNLALAPDPEPSVSYLFSSLPDAETPRRLTPYRPKSTSMWSGNDDGFAVAAMADPESMGIEAKEVISVTFRGVASPAAIVEEMAMLRAADLALEKEAYGFVILGRQDVRHTLTQTGMYSGGRTDPQGYSTRLDITLVDAASLSDRYRDAAWRVIEARKVRDSLGPVYDRPDSPPDRKQN